MAELIKCPACGKDVSDQAVSCPNCGQPIKKEKVDYSSIIDYSKPRKQKPSGCGIGCFVIIIAFAVSMCFGISQIIKNPDKYNRNTAQETMSDNNNNGEFSYRLLVENTIRTIYPDADFDLVMNYRTWSDGTFTMVENQFKLNGIKHKYVARCGGEKIFHLTIDDEVVYYDEEGQWAFMDNNN